MLTQLCIVLKAVNYKDYDKILTLFSRTEGKINAQATGARRLKSEISTASQSFCCAEYEFFQKKDRYFVKGALVKQEFFGIQNDYDKYAAACVMLELSDKVLEHTDEPERLFVTLVNTLFSMEKHSLDRNTALAYFFVNVIDLLGVFPALDFCAVCGKSVDELRNWNAEQGGAVCGECAEEVKTSRAVPNLAIYFNWLRLVKPRETATMHSIEDDADVFLKLVEEYLHIAGDIKLKTTKYLKPQ